MTPTTVWGVATAAGEPAAHRNRFGQLTDAHMYRAFTAQLPEDGVDLDLEHDGRRVGELVYAEIRPDERVHCVCVLDDGDRLLELEQSLYYSATLDMRGCAGDHTYVADEARIIGLSLTLSPAVVAARPLELRRGDVRSQVDRGSWSQWKGTPLLKRCVDGLPRLGALEHRAAHIADRRPLDDEYPFELRGPWRRDPRPVGALRYGPPGRIISVR